MTTLIPKILIVDDEPDLEMLIRQKFRKEIRENKYHFLFAGNGVEALQKLVEDREIELVLTDINMPEMDGLTLLSKIKELQSPALHSVIVSAYGDNLNIRKAMNGGAFDFLIKPIDLTDLEITIKKALANLVDLKKVTQSRNELLTVRKELEEAKALQLSMLPTSIPKVKGIEFAAYMQTASEVGGDYYDFSVLNDDSVNIAFGDATGHGLKAGLMVAVMKTLFVSDSTESHLTDFFKGSNKTIKTLNLNRMMMGFTMLNINKNKVQFVNAGMPPIYFYKKSGDKVIEFENQFMPLGALFETDYRASEFEFDKGDVILILSDGFPEMNNTKGEMLGYSKVSSEFKLTAEKTPGEIIEKFKSIISEWTSDKELEDDITFVVIKKD